MADVRPPSDVFGSILRVLERIEEKLEGQEHRLNAFERLRRPSRSAGDTDSTGEVNLSDVVPIDRSASPKPSIADSVVWPAGEKLETPYSDVGFGCQFASQNADLKNMLEETLGDCWKLPDDKRLTLNLANRIVDGTGFSWDVKIAMSSVRKDAVKKRLNRLRQFDLDHRAHAGNDFFIIDYNPKNISRLYRLGEKALGSELRISPGEASHQQWSRLILYQGMTTGDSIKPRSRNPSYQEHDPIPYFSLTGASEGLWSHLSAHLELRRRPTTTNPYLNPLEGFHTTFYEIRKANIGVNELWRQGPLYDHPEGWNFRKSAYTLYNAPQSDIPMSFVNPAVPGMIRHWTLLVLAPDHFFNENNLSFPIYSQTPQKVETLSHSFGRLHSLGAEMNLIAQGLRKISERWDDFGSFFDFTLDGSDSLMQPSEHDNLLFDDGAFSRSRRYFWAIDCLSEFDTSISDNIKQWELYKEARVLPRVAAGALPELEYHQFKQAEKQCRVLQIQRESMRQKLASTKALRDALFSASAVIESRASTRLGENVKLLTFVNIFFLPLSFCTSLWSINDKFSTTSLIITIVLVATMTYLTMFNVNSMVQVGGTVYDSKKKTVVEAMKADSNEAWRRRGGRFEVFRPKHKDPEPSEWYITLYALLRPTVLLGLGGRGEPATSHPGDRPYSIRALGNVFRKRRQRSTEPERPEEGWVI